MERKRKIRKSSKKFAQNIRKYQRNMEQKLKAYIATPAKFTNEGTIRVAAEKKDSEVVISIKDTGTGIDPEIFPRLFTKFVTTSNTGTGLGLFISKSIVEAHGGKIWAENNRNEKGATFYFSLPLSTQTL
jgi:signal transduction histidine kinase